MDKLLLKNLKIRFTLVRVKGVWILRANKLIIGYPTLEGALEALSSQC